MTQKILLRPALQGVTTKLDLRALHPGSTELSHKEHPLITTLGRRRTLTAWIQSTTTTAAVPLTHRPAVGVSIMVVAAAVTPRAMSVATPLRMAVAMAR